MPTNQQRRETAKRKLERQLERRAQQAKRRRLLTIIGGAAALVAAIAVVVTLVVTNRDAGKSSTTASGAPSDTAGPSTAPRHRRPAGVQGGRQPGANCQYPASPEPASKKVEPPKAGKVPTEPATVSASMATNQGNIGLQLDNAKAPCTVNSFASLAQKGFFNDTPATG